MGLPIGLALNFCINGVTHVIPMVIEEPSVVAAVSGASKTIHQTSIDPLTGFSATATDRNVVLGQVQLLDVDDSRLESAIEKLCMARESTIQLANSSFCSSMAARGGGVTDMTVRKIQKSNLRRKPGDNPEMSSFWLIVHLHIDVCDAMGANCASTVAEGVAPALASLVDARIGFCIVSNLSNERLATGKFRIQVDKMGYKGVTGLEVANRIIESYEWAADDPFRATTHNKGVMNGIDAVALATGQDWRAIEASSHAWASLHSHFGSDDTSSKPPYGPLTKYWLEQDNSVFCGELTLPIPVGTKGGVLKTNPVYRYHLSILGNPTAKQLAMIMVCVGLAQNFAALRALSTEGIQRGHMSLHARNIAIAAGAPAHAIQECVSYMVESGRISLVAAKEYFAAHHLQTQIMRQISDEKLFRSNLLDMSDHSNKPLPKLSMFYFEEDQMSAGSIKDKNGRTAVSLNIAFASYSGSPVNVELTSSRIPNASSDPTIQQMLFGAKTFEWINVITGLLDKMKLQPLVGSTRSNQTLSKKLKFASIILNILARRLIRLHPIEGTVFLKKMIELARISTGSSPNGTQSQWDDISNDMHHASIDTSGQQASPILKHTKPSLTKTPSNSGLFHRAAYECIEEAVTTCESASLALSVGAPLFLAIWQMIQYRVVQWVGDGNLSESILQEQLYVIECLVSTVSASNDAENLTRLEAVVELHARRFQVTMFLLCDSISFDGKLKMSEIEELKRLGSRLEREQAIAHDLSPERLSRDIELANTEEKLSVNGDLRYGVVNTVLIWLVLVKSKNIAEAKQVVERWITSLKHKGRDVEIKEYVDYERSKIESGLSIDYAKLCRMHLSDANSLRQAIELYQKYYGLQI